MNKLLRELVFGFFCLLTSISTAIGQDINFQHVLPLQGSAISITGALAVITGITQDNQGYMWFASSGLYKYDGYHMTHYLHDPSNKNSLLSNYVECVYADREGLIWAGSSAGLDCLDPNTNSFTHYRNNKEDPQSLVSSYVTCILEDWSGDLWIGTTRGLCRMDRKTGLFTRFVHDDKDRFSISNNDIRVIYQDSLHIIWIGCGDATDHTLSGSSGGLNRYDAKLKSFYHYMHDSNDQYSLYDNHIRSIAQDQLGNLWVGTEGNILHKLDRKTGTMERYSFEGDSLSRTYTPSTKTSPLGFDHISFLQPDKTGTIWIGTLLSGLCRLDPISNRVTHFNREKRAGGFPDAQCWWSYLSHEGVLWVTTWEGNVYNVDTYQQNLHYVNIGAEVFALHDYAGLIWIGSRQGLIIHDSTSRNTNQESAKNISRTKGMSKAYPQAFCTDSLQSLWIGTALSGLYQFNIFHHTTEHYVHDNSDSNSITGGQILALAADNQGMIWIGTDHGLDKFDPRQRKAIHFLSNPADNASIGSNYITCLKPDHAGSLWIGTIYGGGITRFDFSTGKFVRYLTGGNVYALFEDSQGRMWVGTDAGVYWSKDLKPFTRISLNGHEQETSVVLSILEDKRQNIWIQTYDALIKLDPEGKYTQYGKNQGYLNLSASGVAGASILIDRRATWGELLYGDKSGYYVVFPENLKSNPNPPIIAISQFRLLDSAKKKNAPNFQFDDQRPENEIQLSYNQNAFSFDLAAIHYTNPDNNSLQYILENYEQIWRKAAPSQTAYFYNLSPGHYILRVRATSSDGVWADKTVSIIINPPWWRTWWAYIIYGALALIALYGIHRYQKARYIQLERERSRAKELAQAKEIQKAYHELRTMQSQLVQQEKMASLGELTAGIAHEIQNPLNFVNNFSEVNAELISEMKDMLDKAHYEGAKSIAEEIAKNEQKIVDHGRRADNIVKGMLQHSRTNTGIKEPTDINAMADEYLKLAYHGLRAKDKEFNTAMRTDFDQGIGSVNVVPQDMGRVLLNLYNNAFYAVMEKAKTPQPPEEGAKYEPCVTVSTKLINSSAGNRILQIQVKDNGNGIPAKNIDKIFQPFFTTKPPGQGTGLGLSLSYDIVKAHGGEIIVESKESEGSSFIVQFPIT
jgi:signal transduction histidine kinase/ligand-binding sensor domain-containing protein